MRRLIAVAVTVTAGVAITAIALDTGGGSANASDSTPATATARVIRTTLASRQQVSGTLDPAGSYTLVSQQQAATQSAGTQSAGTQSAGTINWLPGPGTVISRGQVVYRLDGQPVRLLFGTQSAWRTLELGDSDGADVRQLKQNLRALGFTAYGALTVDDHFDWATTVAIEQWQRAQGVPQTGVLTLGSVAFLPGAVRVITQQALPGSPAQPGTPLLDLSSTGYVVSVPLDPSLRQLVHVGDRVQIQLPQGQTTPGRVSQIGAATAAAGAQASAGSSTPTGADASGQGAGSSSSQGPSQGSTGPSATVPVTVSLDRPRDARGLDQVPVAVGITDTVHRNVLAVPITALLALANGGYAVAVQDHGTRTLIAVRPGVFDGNRVEVSSPRLRPGMQVEVPTS
jgi:hypothetical protein